MCDDWSKFLGWGMVTSGWCCTGEMQVCHNLLDFLLGLLELVGELLVGAGKVFHHLSLVGRGLAVGGGISG